MRLNIAAGTAVRFEPGDEREVELVALGGARDVYGLNALVNGGSTTRASKRRRSRRVQILRRARPALEPAAMKLSRRTYADHYGPTTGDRVRLGDTDLFVRIERDFAIYGEEAKFGGGKVIRDGMGQSPTATRAAGTPDLVITSALVIDSTGIYKADVGIRDGRISAIGKAGNSGRHGRRDAGPRDRRLAPKSWPAKATS